MFEQHSNAKKFLDWLYSQCGTWCCHYCAEYVPFQVLESCQLEEGFPHFFCVTCSHKFDVCPFCKTRIFHTLKAILSRQNTLYHLLFANDKAVVLDIPKPTWTKDELEQLHIYETITVIRKSQTGVNFFCRPVPYAYGSFSVVHMEPMLDESAPQSTQVSTETIVYETPPPIRRAFTSETIVFETPPSQVSVSRRIRDSSRTNHVARILFSPSPPSRNTSQ